jgi:retinol dehydrogenase-12
MDLAFLRRQFTALPYPTHSFAGQTVIVTGSNIGLGLEASRHFLRLGASKLILAVRSIAKGEEALRDIENTTGIKGVGEVWQVDMGNFESIKAFCGKVAGLERIDVICANAGIAQMKYEVMEGTESTVAVNVVGTFLLVLNMLPILRRSGKKFGNTPVVAVTSSEVHEWVSLPLSLANLMWEI